MKDCSCCSFITENEDHWILVILPIEYKSNCLLFQLLKNHTVSFSAQPGWWHVCIWTIMQEQDSF